MEHNQGSTRLIYGLEANNPAPSDTWLQESQHILPQIPCRGGPQAQLPPTLDAQHDSIQGSKGVPIIYPLHANLMLIHGNLYSELVPFESLKDWYEKEQYHSTPPFTDSALRQLLLDFLLCMLYHVVTLHVNYWTIPCNVWLLTWIILIQIHSNICDIWNLCFVCV